LKKKRVALFEKGRSRRGTPRGGGRQGRGEESKKGGVLDTTEPPVVKIGKVHRSKG